jgi:hypothetical protein
VWGGTKDSGRKDTDKGLSSIPKFVENHSKRNVIVMNLPKRYDLDAMLCVNKEVKVFNRKLSKQLKVFDYAFSVELNCARDHYTRYGLLLNIKGKEYSANQIVSTINGIFSVTKTPPIPVNRTVNQVQIRSSSSGGNKYQDDCQLPSDSPGCDDLEHSEAKLTILPTERSRIPPSKRSDEMF